MRRASMAGLIAAIAILSAPLSSAAQPPGKVPRIGVLLPTSPSAFTQNLAAFRQGLRESGYVEGQSIAIGSCCQAPVAGHV